MDRVIIAITTLVPTAYSVISVGIKFASMHHVFDGVIMSCHVTKQRFLSLCPDDSAALAKLRMSVMRQV